MRNDKDGIAERWVSQGVSFPDRSPSQERVSLLSVCCSAPNVLEPPNSERKHGWKGQEVNLLPCATTSISTQALALLKFFPLTEAIGGRDTSSSW